MLIIQESTLVEGVGDEVIYSVTTFLALLAGLLILYVVFSRRRPVQIHPDHMEFVLEARRHLARDAAGPEAEQPPQPRHFAAGEPCPICLVQPSYSVSTNCGHLFCAACLFEYHRRHANYPYAVLCPVCRQSISILLPEFTAEEMEDAAVLAEIQAKVHEYNRTNGGGPRSLMDYIRDMPALLQYLWRRLLTPDGLHWVIRTRVILYFALFIGYVLLPFDLIPEAALGMIGLLDDLLVLLILGVYLTFLIRHVVLQQAQGPAVPEE